MGSPAARIGDMHLCPDVVKSTPPVPHVGGPILTGCASVMIGGMPAAVKGAKCICVGPPDTVNAGSKGVFIEGKPAARKGDKCAHKGKIVDGCTSVYIGDKATKPQVNALKKAKYKGAPVVEVCPYQST